MPRSKEDRRVGICISRSLKLACAAAIAVAVAVFIYWACFNGAFSSAAALVGYKGRSTAGVFGFLALFAGAWVFLLLAQVFCNRYVIALDWVLAAVYVAAALWVILGKSAGIREVNWDIADLFSQVRYFPTGLFLNMAMFVPLGCGLRLRTGSAVKTLAFAFAVSIVLEAAQYAFALGIADVCDVAANVFGTMVGFFAADLVVAQGYRFKRVSASAAILGKVGCAEPSPSANRAVLIVLGACSLAFIVGVAFYPVKPLSAVPAAERSEDPLLARLEDSPASATSALAALSARVNGEECPVPVGEAVDGRLEVEGNVVGRSFWLTDSGELAGGLSVLKTSDIAGTTLSVAVPVVVKGTSSVHMSGAQLTVEELEDALYSSQAYEVQATVENEGSWLKAVDLELVPSEVVSPDVPVVTFDWSSYSDLLGKAPARDTWLDLRNGGSDTVEGYLASTTDTGDMTQRYATVAVPDDTAGVPILHGVNVRLEQDPQVWGRNAELVPFEISLNEGVLRLE